MVPAKSLRDPKPEVSKPSIAIEKSKLRASGAQESLRSSKSSSPNKNGHYTLK